MIKSFGCGINKIELFAAGTVKFWEHGHIVLCAVIVCLFRKFVQQSEAIQLALYKVVQYERD